MACRIKKASTATEELLDECEIEAGELTRMLKELKEFSRPYLKLLPDKRLHERGEDFLRGLLSDLERKSIEPIAERLGQHRRPLQYFVGESDWDHKPMLDLLCRQVVGDLGETNGILVIDPSAFPKKGRDSVGVTRQWCGRLGKKENCQLGVFLGYVSNKGHALVDERLYMPRDWGRDKARRKKCRVPRGLRFATAPRLALDMLEQRRDTLPHRWVVADDEFGRGFAFRGALQRMGERYLLEIPCSRVVRDFNAPLQPKIPGMRGRRKKPPLHIAPPLDVRSTGTSLGEGARPRWHEGSPDRMGGPRAGADHGRGKAVQDAAMGDGHQDERQNSRVPLLLQQCGRRRERQRDGSRGKRATMDRGLFPAGKGRSRAGSLRGKVVDGLASSHDPEHVGVVLPGLGAAPVEPKHARRQRAANRPGHGRNSSQSR